MVISDDYLLMCLFSLLLSAVFLFILFNNYEFKKEEENQMENKIKLTCSCGNVTHLLLDEEYNNKDTLWCNCGKKYIIIDVTEL